MEMRKKELVAINHKSTEYDSFCYNKTYAKNHYTMQDNAIKNSGLTGKTGMGHNI